MFRFPKTPFTCSYRPGKVNLSLCWAIYLCASSAISPETWLLPHAADFWRFLFSPLACCCSAVQWRQRIHPGFEFVFHEEPKPAVHSVRLNL